MRQARRLLASASAFLMAAALLASAVSARDPRNPKHLSATKPVDHKGQLSGTEDSNCLLRQSSLAAHERMQ